MVNSWGVSVLRDEFMKLANSGMARGSGLIDTVARCSIIKNPQSAASGICSGDARLPFHIPAPRSWGLYLNASGKHSDFDLHSCERVVALNYSPTLGAELPSLPRCLQVGLAVAIVDA